MKTRKTIRLKDYDYSVSGLYFITICTKDMENLFGIIKDDVIIYNSTGQIVNNIFKSFTNHVFRIIYYQIMPNHIHFIVEILDNKVINLSSVVSLIKGKCSFELKNKSIGN